MVAPEHWRAITSLHSNGRLDEAEAGYRTMLEENPQHAEAAHMLGMLLHQRGADDEAMRWLRLALDQAGPRPALLVNTARVHLDLGAFEQALALLDRAESSRPSDGEVQLLRFHCLNALGRPGPALAAFRAARELGAKISDSVRFEAACGYQRVGAYVDAIEALDRVIENDRRHTEALLRRGVFRGILGDALAALEDCRAVLAIDPSYQEVHSNLLIRMQYDPGTSSAALFDAHRKWSARHAIAEPVPADRFSNARDASRTLTIGWISPRFDSGLITSFLSAPVNALPPDAFRHVFYSTRANAKHIPEELAELGDWRSTEALDDAGLAALVAQDQVDILMDLAGHNPGNRLRAISRRLAPIQVSWLDYFATTGVEAMDYWLSDPYLSPVGSERYFTEAIVRLPATRLCYTPGAKEVPTGRSERRAGEVIFGSFNRPGKLAAPVLETWAGIVRSVPGSRLVLKAEEFGDARVRDAVGQRFHREGLDAAQLSMRPATPYRQMLAEYADIDVALDPFPFTGCATTCDALWMGVPVISLAGETPVSRQGYSILSNIGHGDWVATDRSEYARLASALSLQIGRGGFDRPALRDQVQHSPLFDAAAQADALSRFFREAWARHCAGETPGPMDLNGRR